jgi:glyoxylase-like metal-dependent hydrolase (beta-lactamase superfamily II)
MTNRRAVLAFGILGGIALVALAVVGPFGGALARAESAPLALDIYTADSQGLGVTSTLIYGDQEAILVDTQFRIADAEKLAERIAAKGRKLKAILITHPHFDHFYGASVLLKRFPGTPVYASPSDIEYIKGSLANTVAQMRARFGEAIPADIQIPQPWPDTHFTVDGQAVEVVAGLQGDVGPGPRNNVVWVPSLAAAIVGDIAFNQVHLSLRATDADSRKAWQETLRLVQERNPRIVVAGHKSNPGLPDTPDVLAFNRAYLTEFEAALAASHNAGELVAAMKQKFPQAGLDAILNFTAARFFPS